jgi:hypothetical protein
MTNAPVPSTVPLKVTLLIPDNVKVLSTRWMDCTFSPGLSGIEPESLRNTAKSFRVLG